MKDKSRLQSAENVVDNPELYTQWNYPSEEWEAEVDILNRQKDSFNHYLKHKNNYWGTSFRNKENKCRRKHGP